MVVYENIFITPWKNIALSILLFMPNGQSFKEKISFNHQLCLYLLKITKFENKNTYLWITLHIYIYRYLYKLCGTVILY